ncbi:hypothetical protein J6590_033035 [Homalodisca vitripennis]|nr:hypothetical protein J6590_033035 [Homalodisca vitripennis]
MEIYSKFLDFSTKNEQDAYLQALVECKPIQRERRNRNNEAGPRKPKQHSFNYLLSTAKGNVEICKTAFLSVHGIKPDRVRRLCSLFVQNKVPKDIRGKPPSGNAKPEPKGEVDYKYYLKTFNEHFHYLSFGRPQVDTCCKCEELSVKIKNPSLNDAAKQVYVADPLVHKRRAKRFSEQIKKVKEMCPNDNTVLVYVWYRFRKLSI